MPHRLSWCLEYNSKISIGNKQDGAELLAADLRFLARVIQVHSEAGTLQFVVEMAEILQVLGEVTLLLKQKGVCAENGTEVLPCAKGFLRGFEVNYQSEES